MNNCGDCEYATWDYEEYCGGAKRWFCTGCRKGMDVPEGDCDEWKERETE